MLRLLALGTVLALVGAENARMTHRKMLDPVAADGINKGLYHIAYLPEQDLIVSKAGLNPGASLVVLPGDPGSAEALAALTTTTGRLDFPTIKTSEFTDKMNEVLRNAMAAKVGIPASGVSILTEKVGTESGSRAKFSIKYENVVQADAGNNKLKFLAQQAATVELIQDLQKAAPLSAYSKVVPTDKMLIIDEAKRADGKADVYASHAGSECDTLGVEEFEKTPKNVVGATSNNMLGASKGSNALHFASEGWTNTSTCDMDKGCTTKIEKKVRSYTAEAPAQTSIIRFALNYGESDGGNSCDKRREARLQAFVKEVREEEAFKVKKAEEEEKARMSKCLRGTQYNRAEEECMACPTGTWNPEKGGQPCKERTSKAGAGLYLDTKGKEAFEDYEPKPCDDEEYSGAEDGATSCTEWTEECAAGMGWKKGDTKTDATCTKCEEGTFKPTKGDGKCAPFSYARTSDCKPGFQLVKGTVTKDSTCEACPVATFRSDDMDECKAHTNECPKGETLHPGSKVLDKKCKACIKGRWKPTGPDNKKCEKQQQCDGTGEKLETAGDAKTNVVCACKDGYKKISAKDKEGEIDCEAVNLCTTGGHNCDKNAKCSHMGPGKFSCTCKAGKKLGKGLSQGGFFGDGKKCVEHKSVCPVGKELSGGSSTEDKTCETCAEGMWKGTPDDKVCADHLDTCPAGKMLQDGTHEKNMECVKCKAGFFKAAAGEEACQRQTSKCPAGQEIKEAKDSSSNNLCVTCAEGFFKRLADDSKCKEKKKSCPAGSKYTKGDQTKDSECSPCLAGKWKGGANKETKCKAWTVGKCTAGTMWTVGTQTIDRVCKPCLKGHFNLEANAQKGDACEEFVSECHPGRYMQAPKGKADQTVNRKCVECAKGSFQALTVKGDAALTVLCAPHRKSEADCKEFIVTGKSEFFSLECGDKVDRDCKKVDLTCKPDLKKNEVLVAKTKCHDACGVPSGKATSVEFDAEAWKADQARGDKLDPTKDIFHHSWTVKKTIVNELRTYCACACKGERTQSVTADKANLYFFDVFKKGLPGCSKANPGVYSCSSTGDPHPSTFSRFRYNYYQYGEYVLSYRDDLETETRLFTGMLNSKIAAGVGGAMRSGPEICRARFGLIKCSTSFANDAEYAKFEASETDFKDDAKVATIYKNGPAICGTTNYWKTNKQVNAKNPIKIEHHGRYGRKFTGEDGTMLIMTFWGSRCYAGKTQPGKEHAASTSGNTEATRSNCYVGGSGYRRRRYMNAYVRLNIPPVGVEDPSRLRMYGICGTPGASTAVTKARLGYNDGQQSARNDPSRAGFFAMVKLPGAARNAREKTDGRMDFRSFFWCKGSDDDFMTSKLDGVEHPSKGQRYWNFLEENEQRGKFRALLGKKRDGPTAAPTGSSSDSSSDSSSSEEEEERTDVPKDPVKEAAVGALLADIKTLPETPERKVPEAKVAAIADDDEKKPEKPTIVDGKVADDDTGAEIKKTDSEKACAAKGVHKLKHGKVSEAWNDCVEDVQVAGGDKETLAKLLDAAAAEEKDEDTEEKETDEEDKKTAGDIAAELRAGAKKRDDAVAPIVEVCPMTGADSCTGDKGYTEVVALPSQAFDSKEWNTIKVVLPVKKGDRVQIRFRQKETTCECCNDFGIDSLQFLTGDKCAPGAVNADPVDPVAAPEVLKA